MNWNDLTIGQFNKIKTLDLNDTEDQLTMIEIITGEDLDKMSFKDLGKLIKKLDFLKEPIPETIIRTHYTLNGREYDCKPNLTDLSVSQYMDYCSVAKENDFVKILAIFITPKGKSYATYDMEQVYKDIESMSVVEAYGVFNFFKMEFKASIKTLQDFLDKQMKIGKLDKQLRVQVLELMDYFCTLDL